MRLDGPTDAELREWKQRERHFSGVRPRQFEQVIDELAARRERERKLDEREAAARERRASKRGQA